MLELASLTYGTAETYVSDIERIVEAGGRRGVHDAVHRLRRRVDSERDRDRDDAERVVPVADPITDRLSGTDGREPTTHPRPVRPGTLSEAFAELLDTLESSTLEPTVPEERE